MDALGQFRENLNLLLQIAATEENRVTREQVQGCFEDLPLTEEQWELIYHYLELNKVEVTDHQSDAAYARRLAGGEEQPEAEEKIEERSAFFAMYLEELAAIPPMTEAEEKELIARMKAGEKAAEDRLVEGKLTLAARIAGEYTGRGMNESDLVQEGNIALILALRQYEDGLLDAFLEQEIRQALELVIQEECGLDDIGAYLAGQANTLLETSTEMAKDLGREPTVEELARRLSLSEEMVREVMKMSLDAVNVVENGKLSQE